MAALMAGTMACTMVSRTAASSAASSAASMVAYSALLTAASMGDMWAAWTVGGSVERMVWTMADYSDN